jgi:hypothetical protein
VEIADASLLQYLFVLAGDILKVTVDKSHYRPENKSSTWYASVPSLIAMYDHRQHDRVAYANLKTT